MNTWLATFDLASFYCTLYLCSMGHAVAYLVEAVCYKPEGGGFDSR
jgi:hypothetical protein